MKSVEEVVNELVVYRVQRPALDPREYSICGVPVELGALDIRDIRTKLCAVLAQENERCLKIAKQRFLVYRAAADECGTTRPWSELQSLEDRALGVTDVIAAIQAEAQ